MVQVQIAAIHNESETQTPVVVLETIDAEPKQKLLIWIGEPEATAIRLRMEAKPMPRPMTHDLIKNIVDALLAQVVSICINAEKEAIFYAEIKLKSDKHKIKIDSRPSDALAVAIRYDAPIYVENEVMDKNAFIEKES